MARRGTTPPSCVVRPDGPAPGGVACDVIYSERRGQSQKPVEIYQLIEELVPGGECVAVCVRVRARARVCVCVGGGACGVTVMLPTQRGDQGPVEICQLMEELVPGGKRQLR